MFSAGKEEVWEDAGGGPPGSGEEALASLKSSTAFKLGERDPDRGAISRDGLNARAAFEVFAGKAYHQTYSLADPIERRVESPLQRFARLRGELDDLVGDLDALVKDEEGSGKSKDASMWSVLQGEARQMIVKMVEIKDHGGFKVHQQLEGNAAQRLKQLSSKMLEASAPSAASATGPSPSPSPPPPPFSEVVALERRVSALETVLGHASNMLDSDNYSHRGGLGAASGTFPLVDAVMRLDRRLSLADPSVIDALRAKAAQLKTELEGVSKAKAASSSQDLQAVEMAKKVDELYERVERVRVVADEAPALIVRLKTLDRVHSAAAGFSLRLDDMEKSVGGLAQELQSNAQVLASLQQGLAENAKKILGRLPA